MFDRHFYRPLGSYTPPQKKNPEVKRHSESWRKPWKV